MVKKRKKKTRRESNWTREITGIALLATGLFLIYCVYISAEGALGEIFVPLMKGLFGIISYALPVLTLILGVLFIASKNKITNYKKLIPTILFVLAGVAILHMITYTTFGLEAKSYFNSIANAWVAGLQNSGAGAVAALYVYPLIALLGNVGAWILFVALLVGCILILTNLSLREISVDFGERVTTAISGLKKEKLYDEPIRADEDLPDDEEDKLFDAKIGQTKLNFETIKSEPIT
ncbi:MAG TPA: hypothetical protein PLZ84_09345, partial [Clostridia bacterium]|nr:hypothetical protein [Clostridia bacterium]